MSSYFVSDAISTLYSYRSTATIYTSLILKCYEGIPSSLLTAESFNRDGFWLNGIVQAEVKFGHLLCCDSYYNARQLTKSCEIGLDLAEAFPDFHQSRQRAFLIIGHGVHLVSEMEALILNESLFPGTR